MKRKWKKSILIIIGLFVIIGITIFAFAKYKEAEVLNKKQLKTDYFYQNSALCSANSNTTKYASYTTLDIQLLINAAPIIQIIMPTPTFCMSIWVGEYSVTDSFKGRACRISCWYTGLCGRDRVSEIFN